MFNLDSYSVEFTKIIDHFKAELGQLRTGRANAAILDNVQVEAYGSRLALKSVGSITVPDARTITIEPWDKNLLKDVEKAIQDANLNVNPVNDGKVVRINMPPLTEESRKDLIKVAGQKGEHARIQIRQHRDSIREKIFAEEKAKTIGEDQRFSLQEKLDKMVKEVNEKIEKMAEEKEREIMTV